MFEKLWHILAKRFVSCSVCSSLVMFFCQNFCEDLLLIIRMLIWPTVFSRVSYFPWICFLLWTLCWILRFVWINIFFSGKNLQFQAIFYSSNSGKQQHISFIVWFGISEKYSHGVNYFNICLSRITILWLLGQHGLYYNTNTWLSLWFFLWKLSRMFEKLGHVFWSKFDQRTY